MSSREGWLHPKRLDAELLDGVQIFSFELDRSERPHDNEGSEDSMHANPSVVAASLKPIRYRVPLPNPYRSVSNDDRTACPLEWVRNDSVAPSSYLRSTVLGTGRSLYGRTSLNHFGIFARGGSPAARQVTERKQMLQEILFGKEGEFEGGIAEDRALGALLGNVVGDALGAPLEFEPVAYDKVFIREMGDLGEGRSFGLKTGQWTDDASMMLCAADSLLVRNGFHPQDMKARFFAWWEFGYNNAFRFDQERGGGSSVGLGGNISQSLFEFARNGRPFTSGGDAETSGNGSLMRLSALPVRFHDNKGLAMRAAALSSLLTHQGDEAADACALLAKLIVEAIHDGDGTAKRILSHIDFNAATKGVRFLSQSLQEDETPGTSWNLSDRDWRWRAKKFRYSPQRAQSQPGYVGSYAMDAIAMALHCVWTTSSFKEAALKAANLRGDADSVCAVTCQLAGAIYGARAIPQDWIRNVQKWDDGGEIVLRAHLLFHHLQVNSDGGIVKQGIE